MRSFRHLVASPLLMFSMAMALLAPARADAPLVIGYVTKSASNQGWMLINKGAQDAAGDAGAQLIVAGPSSQGVLAGQIYAIERVISQGAKAVAIAPVDSTGVSAIVRREDARGVPFVAIDTAIEGAPVKSYV